MDLRPEFTGGEGSIRGMPTLAHTCIVTFENVDGKSDTKIGKVR